IICNWSEHPQKRKRRCWPDRMGKMAEGVQADCLKDLLVSSLRSNEPSARLLRSALPAPVSPSRAVHMRLAASCSSRLLRVSIQSLSRSSLDSLSDIGMMNLGASSEQP